MKEQGIDFSENSRHCAPSKRRFSRADITASGRQKFRQRGMGISLERNTAAKLETISTRWRTPRTEVSPAAPTYEPVGESVFAGAIIGAAEVAAVASLW